MAANNEALWLLINDKVEIGAEIGGNGGIASRWETGVKTGLKVEDDGTTGVEFWPDELSTRTT